MHADVYKQARRITKNERKKHNNNSKAAVIATAVAAAAAASWATNEIDDGRCFNLSIRTILDQGHAHTSHF